MPELAQLGLVRTKGFSSWLIRTVTHSDFNHIVCYVGEDSVVSAETTGVQVLPVEYFPQAVWSNFDLTLHQVGTIISFSRAQLGKPYGVLTFLWCGIARLLDVKLTPGWLRRRLNTRSNWICSQLADSAYKAAGIHLFTDHRAEGAVVPGDFRTDLAGCWMVEVDHPYDTFSGSQALHVAEGRGMGMICDDCAAECDKWLDWHPNLGRYEVRAYSPERNAQQTIENHRALADKHWALVRTQIARIKEDCASGRQLGVMTPSLASGSPRAASSSCSMIPEKRRDA